MAVAAVIAGIVPSFAQQLAFPRGRGLREIYHGRPLGLPVLSSGKAAKDLDCDGIPDALESRFSDIEDYLNWLVR